MFKCKECGNEYIEKPDYCDCGNDTFDEIKETPKVVSDTVDEQTAKSIHQTDITPKQISPNKKNFSEQYPELERIKNSFDPISTVVFMTCLIAALVILLFVGNPDETAIGTIPETQTTETQSINIPPIESFWNNSTVGVINNEKTLSRKLTQTTQTSQPTPSTNIQVTIPQPTQQPSIPQAQNNGSLVTKILGNNTQPTNTQAKKQTQQTTPQTQASKPQASQNTTPKIPAVTQAIATQQKPTTNNTTQTNTQQNTQPQQNTVSQKPTQTTPAAKPTTVTENTNITSTPAMRPKATIDTQALKKELDSYKVGLRNTIGRKVDFTKVIGDGECIVAFKVASDGKLTNRSFAKQSSNITLNDAVYSAVMATPSYNPPPEGYKNETLNLKIRFYSGNYDVTLY